MNGDLLKICKLLNNEYADCKDGTYEVTSAQYNEENGTWNLTVQKVETPEIKVVDNQEEENA